MINSGKIHLVDVYDNEALVDVKHAKPPRAGFNTRRIFACFGVSGCARVFFRALGWLIVLAATAIVLESYSFGLLQGHFTSIRHTKPASYQPIPASVRYQKPVGPKIIGLIFYGRRDRVAILNCYLQRNLVVNGGWLDGVIWGVNTHDTNDLAYLDELMLTSPLYRRLDLKIEGYVNLWNQSVEHGNIYVKIDDDVVYFHEDTIPDLVNTLVTDSKAAVVSANVINSPEHNWLHYRSGAVRAYLPDLEPPTPGSLSTSDNQVWRVSELPCWIGPGGWTSPPVAKFTDELSKLLPRNPNKQSTMLPSHRWLPLDDPLDISITPIAQTRYDAFGPGWSSWAIAAQQHYSFFYNLEMNQLSTYYMNHGARDNSSAIFDHTGDRLSINMLAVTGELILDNIDKMAASVSDESYLTEELPRQINKRKSSRISVCLW
jgi:hypothetical protein